MATGANHPASHHRRSDGGPERRQRCSDGGPEHRYECYTENPPYVSRPNYDHISGGVSVALPLARRGTICLPLMSVARTVLTRLNVPFWQVWAVLHESANVVRLAPAVGENNRHVWDDDRKNCRDRGGPADVVDEQEDGDPKARRAETHHDQVPALPVGDVLGHRPPRLRDNMDVAAAAPLPDPHASTVFPDRWVDEHGARTPRGSPGPPAAPARRPAGPWPPPGAVPWRGECPASPRSAMRRPTGVSWPGSPMTC